MARVPPITLCALLALMSCRQIAGYESARTTDSQSPDASVDRGIDALSVDTGTNDLSIDRLSPDLLPPVGSLTCGEITPVGSGTAAKLQEPAMIDDLTLFARTVSGISYRSSRLTNGATFGAWSPSPAMPYDTLSDQDFFEVAGVRYVIGATRTFVEGVNLRTIQICRFPDGDCQDLELHDQQGAAIVDDVDGPHVVSLEDGSLLMAHNVTPANGNGEIYLARPTDPEDPTQPWTTKHAASISDTLAWHDDPTLSPNGLLIVFALRDLDMPFPGRLFYATRDSLEQPFSHPKELAVPPALANGAAYSGLASPTLHPGPGGILELFIDVHYGAEVGIFRLLCW